MLSRSRMRARRAPASVVALSPNRRSNAALGDCSIGNGDSGPAHEMVPVYTQLRPKSQVAPESTDSSAISSDGSAVSWPAALATN